MRPQTSPDGRWLAYASDETSGRWEVFNVTSDFQRPEPSGQCGIGGGAEPQWRGDGRELYYIAPDGVPLMALDVRTGDGIEIGHPAALFRTSISADIITYRNRSLTTADGHQFLVDTAAEREPINVIVNWSALLNP